MKKRQSGILIHISSLPNSYGIGSFGKSAYKIVDFLKRSKQAYWQILPLGTTSYGDSPYQSFSAFAGNTHFIDLDSLLEAGWLVAEDLENLSFGQDDREVDYAQIFSVRRPLLEKAVQRFLEQEDQEYSRFLQENASWLEDFALYMAIKEHFYNLSWLEWPDQAVRKREEATLNQYRQDLAEALQYHRVTQYWFQEQWQKLKTYANQSGIEIIGDIPIYVAGDSCDMWAYPHYFKVDEDLQPTVVAGCPPDAFSEDGQLWGNPIYDWQAMAEDGYQWWLARLRQSFSLYDIVRIDHFRGFEAYWEIPADSPTAVTGKWVKGPGIQLFETIHEELGDLNIIAEDLGLITEEVLTLRYETGFPGMKVLQFAFDSLGDNDYLPHNYSRNSVVYLGTHDNDTTRAWYENLSPDVKEYVDSYSHRSKDETPNQALIRLALASPAYMAIITMQDLLELSGEARMNLPSTIGGNWTWRMLEKDLSEELEGDLARLTKLYSREKV